MRDLTNSQQGSIKKKNAIVPNKTLEKFSSHTVSKQWNFNNFTFQDLSISRTRSGRSSGLIVIALDAGVERSGFETWWPGHSVVF